MYCSDKEAPDWRSKVLYTLFFFVLATSKYLSAQGVVEATTPIASLRVMVSFLSTVSWRGWLGLLSGSRDACKTERGDKSVANLKLLGYTANSS